MMLPDSGDGLSKQASIFQAMIDGMSDAVLMADEYGRFHFWNATAKRLIGLPPRDMSPEQWSRHYGFYLPDKTTLYPMDQFPLVRAICGETVEGVEVYMRNSRNVQGVWLSLSARPLYQDGTFQGGMLVCRDVTVQKRSQQTMAAAYFDSQRNEDTYRTIVMNIPGAVYRCEAEFPRRMRFISEPIREITGYDASELMAGARPYASLIHPEDAPAVEKTLAASLKAKRPYIIEYRLVRASGETRWVYDKGRGVFGEDGSLLWLDGVLFDVTDRKIAEASVLQKTAELAHNEAEREQLQLFAFIASHDLREPLQKILCAGELLKMDGPLEAKQLAHAEMMMAASLRMGRLIDDILKFTKAATQTDPFQAVPLRPVIEEVLSDLELRIRKSGASVEVGPLPVLEADRVQLRQLFQNLIGNAIKFGKAGRPPIVRVTSGAPDADGFVLVTVGDNGIGFDLKDREKIFRPFERLHRRDEYEGSGIGLAICQKIVARHGGRIDVDSAPGRGTVFTIRLPLARTQAREKAA
ncbi:MAG TPA: ATP-binding protein [Candidatus Eisenbacteria bacterium]|jgi:PAS domain S-box-containing protein|nr:ATP-binding protein [Candidatus Eisenbacteria bacterium]